MNLYFYFLTSESRDRSAYILTTHGGHLGFYEGGLLKPNPVTWLVCKTIPVFSLKWSNKLFPFRLDRTAVGIADAILRDTHSKSL